ncbi:MAG: GNAT family N-acyltransferase [Bacteroidota bacterium]
MKKMYTFSEVTNKEDLEKCFQMRYAVYAESANKVRLKQNPIRIDINVFDVHAKHYCLRKDDSIIGYLRLVLPSLELVNESVLEIGDSYSLPLKAEYSRQKQNAPYPFLSYTNVPPSHWNYYTEIRIKGEQLIEASRLILHPEYRGLNVSRFLVECALVLYIEHCDQTKHAIVDCFTNHSTFYKSYGFSKINEDPYLLFGIPNDTLTLPPLSQENDRIPSDIRNRLTEMAEEYKVKGVLERVL